MTTGVLRGDFWPDESKVLADYTHHPSYHYLRNMSSHLRMREISSLAREEAAVLAMRTSPGSGAKLAGCSLLWLATQVSRTDLVEEPPGHQKEAATFCFQDDLEDVREAREK